MSRKPRTVRPLRRSRCVEAPGSAPLPKRVSRRSADCAEALESGAVADTRLVHWVALHEMAKRGEPNHILHPCQLPAGEKVLVRSRQIACRKKQRALHTNSGLRARRLQQASVNQLATGAARRNRCGAAASMKGVIGSVVCSTIMSPYAVVLQFARQAQPGYLESNSKGRASAVIRLSGLRLPAHLPEL